jgi:hypothetical protein
VRDPAVPVVDVCACAPGVGPEPASLLAVVQGPANAVPLRSIALQPAKRMYLTFIGKLLRLEVEDNPGDYATVPEVGVAAWPTPADPAQD